MKEFAPVTPGDMPKEGISYRKHPVAKPCREGDPVFLRARSLRS